MPVKILERDVEASLIRYAKANHILTHKFSSPSKRGVPDRIFIHGGKVLFLEIKAPGKTPSALQFNEMKKIKEHGGLTNWVDNVESGKQLLDHYFFNL